MNFKSAYYGYRDQAFGVMGIKKQKFPAEIYILVPINLENIDRSNFSPKPNISQYSMF